jgi:mannose-6-phosphate isomerase-like protein (cupin superfamily)
MKTLDLGKTYLHLLPTDRAASLPGGDAFWSQLMSGRFEDARVADVADGGWLVTRFTHRGDWEHWEMHPEGDEVLTALSGGCVFHLEVGGTVEEVPLVEGRTLVVPAGVWHRATGDTPTEILALTAGKGTQHRPA